MTASLIAKAWRWAASRRLGVGAPLLLMWLTCTGPASAQTNLVGYWNPLFHEDVDERIPGPSIGDYLGLPITDAARLRAEAWDASLLVDAGASVQAASVDLWFSRRRRAAHLGRPRRGHAAAHQDPHAYRLARAAPRDLDGRAPASARLRRAHLAGFLDGQLGGRRPGREDDASEGGLDAPQRFAAQRPRDDDRSLPPLRRPHDARDDRRGSRVLERTAREDERIPAAAERHDDSLSLRPRDRGRARSRLRPALSARSEPVPRRVRRDAIICHPKQRAAVQRRRCPNSRRPCDDSRARHFARTAGYRLRRSGSCATCTAPHLLHRRIRAKPRQ